MDAIEGQVPLLNLQSTAAEDEDRHHPFGTANDPATRRLLLERGDFMRTDLSQLNDRIALGDGQGCEMPVNSPSAGLPFAQPAVADQEARGVTGQSNWAVGPGR